MDATRHQEAKTFMRRFLEITRGEHPELSADHDLAAYYVFLDASPSGFDKHLRYLGHLAALGGRTAENSVILDVGCSYGLNVFLFAILGAARSHGLDIQAKCLRAFDIVKEALLPPGHERAEVRRGDARALPFDDASIDLILAMESISHMRDTDAFFREAHRVLRPGGALVIADSNNGSNPWVRWKNQIVWDVAENGPPGRRAGDYVCLTPYVEMRRGILRRAFPDLDQESIRSLAANTFGMVEEEIVASVRAFLEGGPRPGSVYTPGRCPVNPLRGYCIENVFEPWVLARRLERLGFASRTLPYFGAARGGLVKVANDALSATPRLTMPFSWAFRVVTVKPPAGT